MIVVGLVLIVVSALLFAGAVVGGGSGKVSLALGPIHIETTPMTVFLLGAGAMLLFFVGLTTIRHGLRRARERRHERKRIDKLSHELDAARRDAGQKPASDPDAKDSGTQSDGTQVI